MGHLLGICIKIFSDVFLIQELFKKILNFRKLLYDCYTFLHKKIIHPSHISTKKNFKSRFFTLHLLQQILIAFSHLQLFRRVAAALPGMEQTEPKKGESILCCFIYMYLVMLISHYAGDVGSQSIWWKTGVQDLAACGIGRSNLVACVPIFTSGMMVINSLKTTYSSCSQHF